MTFQIQAINIHNFAGERRTISLQTGAVNIITGRSATGKSSILDIIAYCFGGSYSVAGGVIRNAVRFYSIELVTDDSTVLVARAAPAEGRSTSTQMHVSLHPLGSLVEPTLEQLAPNHDVKSALSVMGGLLGIPNITTDAGMGTRKEFQITPKHALYFCLQGQSEVANPDVLFHGQSEEWAPQVIRDVLPFFLGVVDPLFVTKRNLLQVKERSLRALERKSNDVSALRGPSSRARGLVREAVEAGLLPDEAAESSALGDEVSALARAMETPTSMGDPDSDDQRVLSRLEEEREQLRVELSALRRASHNLRQLVRSQSGFTDEASVQIGRLKSIELLGVQDSSEVVSTCPLCGSAAPCAESQVSEIREHLAALERQIGEVAVEVPRVQETLGEYETRIAVVNEKLAANKSDIDGWFASRALLEQLRERSLFQAAVRGRVGLYLESVQSVGDEGSAKREIQSLIDEIEDLRSELDLDAMRVRLDGVLSRMSHVITAVASRLELEHSSSPARFDMARLTVVVDTPAASLKLSEVGSAENWLGYHLATLLAMHSRFLEAGSPVPRFLVLDQPSQVYFPPDATGDDVELDDDDRAALRRFYQELKLFVDFHPGSFQVLVIDHADEAEAWFQNSVVERWRGGRGLVPTHWIDSAAGAATIDRGLDLL